MAVASASDKFSTTHKQTITRHTSGTTSATDVAWVDLRDYSGFAVTTFTSELSGAGVDAFTILANSDSAGGNTDVEIKAHAVGDIPNAVGDSLFLECTAEEVGGASTSASGQLRYVSANLTHDNNSDVTIVVYERFNPRFAKADLTADNVSA